MPSLPWSTIVLEFGRSYPLSLVLLQSFALNKVHGKFVLWIVPLKLFPKAVYFGAGYQKIFPLGKRFMIIFLTHRSLKLNRGSANSDKLLKWTHNSLSPEPNE